jgi:hypothetical protein
VEVVFVVGVVEHGVAVDVVDRATAQMSPGMPTSISVWFLPCTRSRWPTLKGLRASPMKSWVLGVTVPWWMRNRPSLPRKGSLLTWKTWAMTCLSASVVALTAGGRAFALQELGRVAFGGVGQQAAHDVEQLGDAGARAGRGEAHGIRWPSRRRCSKGSWSCSGCRDSPCSR